ncbi:hypothetical protein GGR55DRAFT_586481 [Xylaria sp. FL0064]|nr:hypothetical protein GGR55DRAFT_586481 [Xylaria sp. FL0064]
MAACPERDFKDPKAMLRHLKQCEFFPQGKFWCPLCQRNDSFKVVSKTKCSWDKMNIARRLWQKLRNFQNKSSKHGRPHCCCHCHASRNDTPPSSQSEFPIPPAGFGVQPHQVGEPAAIWELPNTAISELYEINRKSHYAKTLEVPQQPSWNGVPLPVTPSHQISPSEPSPASLGRSNCSSDISPASASHVNESPVLGRSQVSMTNVAINIEPLPLARQASQASRRGEVPLLTVDTRQSVPNTQPPDWMFNMLLDEGQTLGCSTGINDLGAVDFTSIITPQPNEILPLHTAYVTNESLAPPDNMDIHPSPSVSIPSYSSNCDISPSSMSSGPEPIQCHHTGCDFKPSGRAENFRAYLRKHVKKHQKNMIPCEHCDKTFTRQDNLTNHIRKVHPSVSESLFKRRRGSLESLRSAGQPRRKESRREPYGTC